MVEEKGRRRGEEGGEEVKRASPSVLLFPGLLHYSIPFPTSELKEERVRWSTVSCDARGTVREREKRERTNQSQLFPTSTFVLIQTTDSQPSSFSRSLVLLPINHQLLLAPDLERDGEIWRRSVSKQNGLPNIDFVRDLYIVDGEHEGRGIFDQSEERETCWSA